MAFAVQKETKRLQMNVKNYFNLFKMFLYIWLKFIAMIFYMFCNIQIHDSIQLNFQAPRQTIIMFLFPSCTHNINKLHTKQHHINIPVPSPGYNTAKFTFVILSKQHHRLKCCCLQLLRILFFCNLTISFRFNMLLIKELKLIAHFDAIIMMSMLRFVRFFFLLSFHGILNWKTFFFALGKSVI